MGYKRIFVISDLHAPYCHPEALDFIKKINKQYKPDCVVNMGDELDYSASSYHESSTELDSPAIELEKGRKIIKELEKIFPKLYLLESNHGSMAFRKANTAKIPVELLKPYNEMLGVSNKWTWHHTLTLEASNGEKIYFVHQQSSNVLQVCAAVSMNVVQAHYHTRAVINYISSPEKLMWAMNVGCLIDKDNLAFKYSRVAVKRPVLSCAVITDGIPHILPMVLKKVVLGMAKFMSDPVNHPDHYTNGKQEVISVLENTLSDVQFQGYLKGNILKYLLRYDHISKEPKYQSLEKAEWYLKILIEKVKKMLEGVSENIEYMARTIWGEARGEDEQGKIAVGHVIKNRKDKQTWMGKTIKDVCLKKWQFSCWNENDPNRNKILALKLNDLEDYLELSAKVISGMYDDPTKGSTHYYAKSMKSPPKWAEGKEPVYDHGGHLFLMM